MKTQKIPLSLLLLFLLISCKSSIIDFAFEKKGIYDDKVQISKVINSENEIAFIPMHHVGRLEFYNDVKNKIDSLQKNGYTVFYEKLKSIKTDSISKYKFRKLINFQIPENGYMELLNLNNLKLKYQVVKQPSYEDLNVNMQNSVNADMSIEEIIQKFENLNGKIELEECDFLTKYNEKYKCKNKFLDDSKRHEVIIDYRNDNLLELIKNSSNKKIVIVYGKEHFIGIKEKLKQLGYTDN